MKGPRLVIVPWGDDNAMSCCLENKIRTACSEFGVDYDTTAHWNVESMTASPDGLVVCLVFFGTQPQ